MARSSKKVAEVQLWEVRIKLLYLVKEIVFASFCDGASLVAPLPPPPCCLIRLSAAAASLRYLTAAHHSIVFTVAIPSYYGLTRFKSHA